MSAWASQLAGSKKARKSRRLAKITRAQAADTGPVPVRDRKTGGSVKRKTKASKAKAK